jgi:Subtilase family
VALAESVDTHGEFETWSDGISALDGDPDVHGVFELITDGSGTADGVYVDDFRFICRASNYNADSYYFNEGTSMATPHVSGVAALVRAAVPSASAAQVAAAIREGAVPLSSLAGKTVTGGWADAPAAIAAARRLTQPAPDPEPDPPGNQGNPGDSVDRTPPRARIGRASVRGRFLLMRLSFPNEAQAVTGTVAVAKLQRGAVRYRTRPRRAVVVKVRLRPSARRALASRGRARAAVTIRARDATGNSSVARSRIRLRAP